ncbi:hypothetical protein, partial [Rhodohalobacter sp.]|uniref:hypothetical protein n=1 Tax=Rhodohalobacter sp. TaxID=1974210 RepID=UPI003567649D
QVETCGYDVGHGYAVWIWLGDETWQVFKTCQVLYLPVDLSQRSSTQSTTILGIEAGSRVRIS